MQRNPQGAEDSRNGSNGDTPFLDPGKIDTIRMLDPEGTAGLLNKIVGLFIEKSADLIGRIQGAVAAGDAEGVFRAAHSLKSSSATIGAVDLADTCRQLETMGRRGALQGADELSRKAESEFHRVCAALDRMREGM